MNHKTRNRIERLIYHAPKVTISAVLLLLPITFIAFKIKNINAYTKFIPLCVVVGIIFTYSRISKNYGKSLVKYGATLAKKALGQDTAYVTRDKSLINKNDPSIWRDDVESTEIDGILSCKTKKNHYTISNIKTFYKPFKKLTENSHKEHKNRTVFKGVRIASTAKVKNDIALHIRTSNMITGYEFDNNADLTIQGKSFKNTQTDDQEIYILQVDDKTSTVTLGAIGKLLDDFTNKHTRECSIYINDGEMSLAIRHFQFFRFQETINHVSRGFVTDPTTDLAKDMTIIIDALELMDKVITILN